jgi:hypothetical protein
VRKAQRKRKKRKKTEKITRPSFSKGFLFSPISMEERSVAAFNVWTTMADFGGLYKVLERERNIEGFQLDVS